MRKIEAAGVAPVLLGIALMAAGCEEPPVDPGAAGPYVIGTRVFDDTSITSYFHVAASLDEGTELDPARALEVAGSARLYSYAGGWFAIGGGETPNITRYSLNDQGELIPGETISLQPFGVADLWDTVYFISSEKAYYPDRAGAQLVVWNPSTMEVTGTVALPDTIREGYLALYSYVPVMDGDQLLFSVGWFDWENDRVLPETGLVVLDTTSDTVTRFDVDTRCGGVTTPVVTESGDAYFVSSALAGAAYRLERVTTAPCALRIRAGEDAFDTEYLAALGEVAGAEIAGEPVGGRGQEIFLRVLDDELATTEDVAATWEITGQLAWRWVRWNVDTDAITPVTELEPSTADVVWFEVDGRMFGTETTADYSETTIIDLTAEGGPQRGLTAPGFLHAMARVR